MIKTQVLVDPELSEAQCSVEVRRDVSRLRTVQDMRARLASQAPARTDRDGQRGRGDGRGIVLGV